MQLQLDNLGIDYIDKRNSLVDAVTMADVKRVAKRLLEAKMLITMVGKPQPAPPSAPKAAELATSPSPVR